jgi:hypothetical protein
MSAEDKMDRMKAAFLKQDVGVTFFGRVLDDHDAPVEGASINADIIHFSPDPDKLFGESKVVERTSDANGFFSVEHEKGRSLYINSISKEGYDGSMLLKQERSFQYAEHGSQKPFVADRKSPVVFRIRNQGGVAFLLRTTDWSCQLSASESGSVKGYDFIRQMPARGLAKPFFDGEPLTSDLQVKATFNTNDATWTVVLSSGTTNGGIVVSDQLLYEAPATGYQQEYTFTPEARKPMKTRYVYLRSRSPYVYSRLEVEYCTVDKKFVRVEGKSVTNPYGDRNLEQATDLPYEVTKQLTDEAKTSFRQHKRSAKPDLPKMVKEAKEKVDKSKQKTP